MPSTVFGADKCRVPLWKEPRRLARLRAPAHSLAAPASGGTAGAGSIARFARSSMLEVINRPYMRTAQAKGLRRPRRIMWHAVPNAAIPIVTLLGFRLGDMIAGSVVVEAVFAWPGLSRYGVNVILRKDLNAIMGTVLIIALTFLIVNIIVDLLIAVLNPRIRHSTRVQS